MKINHFMKYFLETGDFSPQVSSCSVDSVVLVCLLLAATLILATNTNFIKRNKSAANDFTVLNANAFLEEISLLKLESFSMLENPI